MRPHRLVLAVLLCQVLCTAPVLAAARLLAQQVQAPAVPGLGGPLFAQRGMPYVVRDGYATNICISDRAGRILLPYLAAPAVAAAPAPGLYPTPSTGTNASTQGNVP